MWGRHERRGLCVCVCVWRWRSFSPARARARADLACGPPLPHLFPASSHCRRPGRQSPAPRPPGCRPGRGRPGTGWRRRRGRASRSCRRRSGGWPSPRARPPATGGGGEEREKKRGKGSERMSARVCAWGRRDLGQPGRPHRGRTGGREAVPPHGAAPSTRGTGSKGRPARLASTKSHGGPNRPMGFVSRRRGRGPFPPIPAPVPPPALGRRQVGCTYRADEGEQEEVAHGVVADVERKR